MVGRGVVEAGMVGGGAGEGRVCGVLVEKEVPLR